MILKDAPARRTTETSETPKHEFTGIWIPKFIWEHPKLGCIEKCLFAEIHTLGGYKGKCFASNCYLAKKMDVSERRIQVILLKLKDLGLIKQVFFDGRRRHLRTFLDDPAIQQDITTVRGRGEENFMADTKKTSPIDNSIEYSLEKDDSTELESEHSSLSVMSLEGTKSRRIPASRKEVVEFFKTLPCSHGPDPEERAVMFIAYNEGKGWKLLDWRAAARAFNQHIEDSFLRS